jgi:hypothetical protein
MSHRPQADAVVLEKDDPITDYGFAETEKDLKHSDDGSVHISRGTEHSDGVFVDEQLDEARPIVCTGTRSAAQNP